MNKQTERDVGLRANFKLTGLLEESDLYLRPIVAFLIYRERVLQGKNTVELGAFTATVSVLIDKYEKKFGELAKANVDNFTDEELMELILNDEGGYRRITGLPRLEKDLVDLICRLLDLKDGDTLTELCTGTGSFMKTALEERKKVLYKGYEDEEGVRDIAVLRAFVLGITAKIRRESPFFDPEEGENDKIFFTVPRRVSLPEGDKSFAKIFYGREAAESCFLSAYWLYTAEAISKLSDKGLCLSYLPKGALNTFADKPFRETLVENGYVKAVISLPDDFGRRNGSLILYSKGNEKIRFVDAGDLFSVDCKAEDSGTELIKRLEGKDEGAISVLKQDVLLNNSILQPDRYLKTHPTVKNGVRFGTVATFKRGAQFLSSELRAIQTTEKTPFRYLSLSEINDGNVFWENELYLKEIDEKKEKYCIKDGEIALAKLGTPDFKSAVIKVEEGETVLLGGNLYIVTVDREKADPYYVQAFLTSTLGKSVLSDASVGNNIKTLTVDGLNNLLFPLPPLEEQRKIGEKYEKSIERLKALKTEYETVLKDIADLF